MKKKNKVYLSLALAVVLLCALSVTAFATGTGDPLAVINKLSDFIFGLIRAVGTILLGWASSRWGYPSRATTPASGPMDSSPWRGALSSPSPRRF